MDWKMCAAIGLLLLATGCAQRNTRPVSEKEFGKDWPLTVPSGTLACVLPSYWHDVHYIIFISPEGKEYTLEGKTDAKGKYLPIYSILKPAPQKPHYKFVAHRVLIFEGFELCMQ